MDYLIKNIVLEHLVTGNKSTLNVIIAGGGEPTLRWDLFAKTVDYIKEQCTGNKINYRLEITTNGCHTTEQTRYIIENF